MNKRTILAGKIAGNVNKRTLLLRNLKNFSTGLSHGEYCALYP